MHGLAVASLVADKGGRLEKRRGRGTGGTAKPQ